MHPLVATVAETTFDIGPNLRTIFIVLLSSIFGGASTIYSRRASKAVTPNGGGSMADSINRIETKVDQHTKDIADLKNGKHV